MRKSLQQILTDLLFSKCLWKAENAIKWRLLEIAFSLKLTGNAGEIGNFEQCYQHNKVSQKSLTLNFVRTNKKRFGDSCHGQAYRPGVTTSSSNGLF